MVSLLFKSMRPMISPQILKMRRSLRFAKPKPLLRRSEKKCSNDFQLFRGKTTAYFYLVKFSDHLVGLPEHPTINFYDFKRKIIYARLSVAN